MIPPTERERGGKPLAAEGRLIARGTKNDPFSRRARRAARHDEEKKRMENNARPEAAADRQSTSNNRLSWSRTDAQQRASQERQQDLPNTTTEQPTPLGEDDTGHRAGMFDGPERSAHISGPDHSDLEGWKQSEVKTGGQEAKAYSATQRDARENARYPDGNTSPELDRRYERDEVGLSQAAATDQKALACSECGKSFKRHSDLAKHTKSHSRPFKCPEIRCKYHEHGWPTAKELDRHINDDKHNPDSPQFPCQYSPCPYTSKREANTKQHMEKAHGWNYVRSRTAGKQTNSLAEPKPPTLRDEFMGYQAGNPVNSASKTDIATAYQEGRGEAQRIREQHPSSLGRGPSSAQRNSFLQDVKSPTAYHTGDLPSIPADDPKLGSDEPMQTLGHGIIRGFVPEETPYGSDKPAASSPNANAKRPRARFQLGTSDDSDDGDQSLPTNSVAIASGQSERERKKARGTKSELRVHPSDDQTDRAAPSLSEGWEFDYDGTRWFYRHKPSGVTQFHFPKPGDDIPDYINPSPLSLSITPEETRESLQQSWERYAPEEAFSERANPLTEEQNRVDFPAGLPHATATVPRSYTCAQCYRVFDQLHKLNHHMGYHERPHACLHPGCGKRFGTMTDLDRHANVIHSVFAKFYCLVPDCHYGPQGGEGFSSKDSWRRHMLNQHNIDNPLEPPQATHATGKEPEHIDSNMTESFTSPEAQARSLFLQNNLDPERLNPEQFQAFTQANPRFQANVLKTYAANLQEHYDTQLRQNPTSYWSVAEATEFPNLLRSFGTDWQAIAHHMKNKTGIMVKDYYTRNKDAAKPEWEAIAAEADNRRRQPPPRLTTSPSRFAEKHDQQQQVDRPTYTRMSLRHLDIDTLIFYKIDWEYDQDPDYVLIKRWVPDWEQNQLWQHTRQIRHVRGSEKRRTDDDQFTLVTKKEVLQARVGALRRAQEEAKVEIEDHVPPGKADGLGPKIWTGTRFLPRFVRAAEVPGEGMCYFYDDGSHCRVVVDGEPVNAHWGVTKAGKPRKRLSIACVTCREKKIKCDPDYPRCVQCEKSGRVCSFINAPNADHDVVPTYTTDLDEQTLKRAEDFLGDTEQPVTPSILNVEDWDQFFGIEGYNLLDVSEQRLKASPVGIASATPGTSTEAPDVGSTQTSAHLGYGAPSSSSSRQPLPPLSQTYPMAAGWTVTPLSRQMSLGSDQDVQSPCTLPDVQLDPALYNKKATELLIREHDVKHNSEIMVSMGESGTNESGDGGYAPTKSTVPWTRPRGVSPLPSDNDLPPFETHSSRSDSSLHWSDEDPLELQPQTYSVPDSSLDYRDNAPTDSGYASLPRQDKVGSADEPWGNVQSAEGPSEMAQLDLDSLDAGTVYSDDKSESSGSRTQRYMSEFVDHFLGKVRHQLIGDNAQRLSSCLPDMLKAFALKFGQTSSTRGHREVMYFVHKNRKSIAQSIQDRLRAEDNQAPVESRAEDPSDMSIEEKLRLWARKEASQDFERETDNLADLEDEIDTKELARYQSLIMDSPAFDWLLESVQRELRLGDTVVDAMTQIRQQILEGLPAARQISRKRAIPSVRVSFNVQWDPLSFIEEQGYDGDFEHVFGKIITLTGSATDVQAATCEQYLCQTWPSTGKHMLRILQGTMGRQSTSSGSASESRTYIFPDNTRIAAFHENKTLTLEASGTTYSMAEIGEQLGWLVAAIRSSRYETEMSLCRPQVRQFRAGADPSQPFSCEIGVGWMAGPSGKESGNGRCWHGMFNNPAIVWGYPIPRRQPLERGTGLEIPLDMLMALADATTVSEFDNKTFIKGFSAMLIPTNQVDDMILWHLLFNEDGSRISYIDYRASGIQHISPTGLREARHILGWTTKAKNHTGSPDANYDIRWSGLGKPRERHAWEKVVISGGGNGISLGASIVIGKKDKAISAGAQGGYISRLKFIAKQYVVMYDLSDRRAWLVDGLSALLHLVRASLEHDEKDVFNPFCLYKKGQLQEASSAQHGADAAAAILLNQANCSLRLYIEDSDAWDEETEQQKAVGHGTETVKEMVSKKKVTYYCLRDRVLEIWSMLEKMIDHLNNVQSESGVGFRLRGTPRNILEGFDFMDVATNNAPVRPHMVKLNVSESGRGWIDLLRSIQAVTLFGKGFGDLITPATDISGNPCDNCGYAVNLPVGKDYMGTCVNLVEQILTTRGSTETVPWCLVDDIYWHTPGSLFEPCRCSGTSKRTSCDRAQVLLPSSHPKLWGRHFASPKSLESQGAVMFSHTWKVPFRNNNNNNKKPEPDSLSVPDRDSGLGTSLDSLSARSDLASGSTDGAETQDDMLVDGSTSSSVILPSQADVNCDMTDDTLPPGCTSVQMPPPDCDSGFGPGEATPAATCRKRKREMVSDMVGSIKKKFARPPPGIEMEQLSLETREAGSVGR